MIKVSVIIPVYNGAKFIKNAIDSVIGQTNQNFEIIVIDDGSIDNTPNILKGYGDKIKYNTQENKGQASAINKGLKMSEGEYIAYLDSDDMYYPEKLEEQLQYFHNHPDVSLVYSDRYHIDSSAKNISLVQSRQLDHFLFLQENRLSRSSVMHRRKCLDEVGVFDNCISGSDDWDMWIRMSEKYKFGYINKPLIKYRIHENNLSQTRPNRLNHNRWTRMKIIQKCYYRRGKPFGLKLMLIRAKFIWIIGKIPILGKRCRFCWAGLERIFELLERAFIKNIFNIESNIKKL